MALLSGSGAFVGERKTVVCPRLILQTDMGGFGAMIPGERSVNEMLKVIAGLTLADTGQFFGYDGRVIPW